MPLLDAFLLDAAPLNFWVAARTDGVKGSGTHSDPYNASPKVAAPDIPSSFVQNSANTREIIVTLANASNYLNGDLILVSGDTRTSATLYNGVFAIYGKSGNTFRFQIPRQAEAPSTGNIQRIAKVEAVRFDDVMNSLPGNSRIHLGPTPVGRPFLTRGYSEGVAGGWQPKPGMKIVGSGIDVTVLQLVGASTADKQYYAIGHDLKTSLPAANPLDFVEVSELTIDGGLHAQPVASGKTYAPVSVGAVRLMGSHCRLRRIKAVNWGSKSTTQECIVFDLIAATGDPYVVETVNSGIEDCLALAPGQNSYAPATAFSIRGIASSTRLLATSAGKFPQNLQQRACLQAFPLKDHRRAWVATFALVKLSSSFLCFVMLCSCSKSPRTVSTSHGGDLGPFILRTIEEHGGHAKMTNGLPQIQCEWRKEVLTGAEYLEGREQVTIRITGDRFQQVTGFLAQALGPPIEPPKMHTNGFLHGWYSSADIGGGLQFYQGRNETSLILVGELKR